MLNKPKFMRPSTNKEECTIDVTADSIPFSCIVDGNESINAWQIVIYDIITNDIVFDSNKVDLTSSFYPVDEKNRNVVFSVNLKNYIPEDTAFKNRLEAYYWTITLWGASGVTTTSYQEVFYANKTPSIKFSCNGDDSKKFQYYGNIGITPTDTSSFIFEVSSGIIKKYEGADIDVVIPYEIDGVKVTSVGSGAFSRRSSLTSVIIPSSVTSIDTDAFYECSSLKNITIPDSVIRINSNVFGKCNNLTDVYYKGTNEQWNNIEINSSNTPLWSATIHCVGNQVILNRKDCIFKAELDFGDNEIEYESQLKRYGWKITDIDNGQVLVDTITKNQIYGSADNIICDYDGFLNGSNYNVELYVETQNNTKITSSFKFLVSYSATFLSNDFKVETLKNEPAVMLNWDKSLVIAGILKDKSENIVSVDDTTFKTNYPVDNQCSIEIPNGFKVAYSDNESLNFDIDEGSYIAFSTQLLSDKDVTLFSSEGEEIGDDGYYSVSRELKYSSGIFTYRVVGQNGIDRSTTYPVTNKPSEYVWYNIFMSPLIKTDDDYTVELNIYEGRVEDCIYPSKDLYPMAVNAWASVGSANFYPIFGRWTNLNTESNVTGAEV